VSTRKSPTVGGVGSKGKGLNGKEREGEGIVAYKTAKSPNILRIGLGDSFSSWDARASCGFYLEWRGGFYRWIPGGVG
jgi:hypothetical protein